jgi:hypothetical protein
MKRVGTIGDLFGPVLWLLSPTLAFVTGIVVPMESELLYRVKGK